MEEIDRAETLVEVMQIRADHDPGGICLIFQDQPVTFALLAEKAYQYAANMHALGIRKGDRVCLMLPTSPEFFYAFLGILILGAIPVTLYPIMSPQQLTSIINNCKPVAAIAHEWVSRNIKEAQAQAAAKFEILFPAHLESAVVQPLFPDMSGQDIALIQYTSGSIDDPKGVVLSHQNLLANIRAFEQRVQVNREDTLVSWLPLYHDMGLIGFGLGAFCFGARLVLLPPDLKNPRTWLEAITRYKGTVTGSPDFGYRNCLKKVHDKNGLDLSSLRVAINGAEPIRLSTIKEFEERFQLKNVICPGYGLAEATLAVAIWEPGQEVKGDSQRNTASVGKPLPGIEIKIVRDNKQVSANETGEIWVKSPGNFQGYYNNPDKTQEALYMGEWLRTGDLGYLDEQGYLFIVGREKEVIIQAGRNMIPGDLEAITDQVSGVRYSAAISQYSYRAGTQRVFIIAESQDGEVMGLKAREIVQEITHRIYHHQGYRPSRVILVKKNTIPRTTSGKIQRLKLAQMFSTGQIEAQILYPTRPLSLDK